jgi:hypothetical protein
MTDHNINNKFQIFKSLFRGSEDVFANISGSLLFTTNCVVNSKCKLRYGFTKTQKKLKIGMMLFVYNRFVIRINFMLTELETA